jgi:hypothetical protein
VVVVGYIDKYNKKVMAASGFNTSFGTSNQYAILNNSLGSDRKNQTEYKKILCAYHST